MTDAPEPADPALACPRCGGPPAKRRSPTAKNPFLPKSKRLCCSLCGLDYDKGARPWVPDAAPSSGRTKR